ncbi:Eukaryotic translation initiation factor 3 subunit K [Clonorchis sinensis]|uniref:Eukaryotic translation initiation factor 3 subunit K n=1 Tax=Clonorchis sinensis TaxID=79923 RepID=A0A8T1LZB4_CLOSI|nr:Eukaryotic translation initiation factor 3 subunit K [Clonorchis sinensis]
MDPKANIHRLLNGIENYNPEHKAILEQHLNWQASTGEYDFEANLALLRLYQFYPELFNADATRLVLLKALASLNPTDFTICKYLIHLDRLNEEPLSLVIELGTLLESCQFPDFWLRLRENPNITSGVPGFRDAMVKFIVQIVRQTYQRIHKSLLLRLFDMSEAELRQLIKQNGWTECPPSSPGDPNGPLILVNKHEENVKSVKIQERVDFDAITSMSGAFRPAKGDFFIKTG